MVRVSPLCLTAMKHPLSVCPVLSHLCAQDTKGRCAFLPAEGAVVERGYSPSLRVDRLQTGLATSLELSSLARAVEMTGLS
jgi:hypothetical protein